MKIFALLVAFAILVNQCVLVQGVVSDIIYKDIRFTTRIDETPKQIYASIMNSDDPTDLREWTRLVVAISQLLDRAGGPPSEAVYYDNTIKKLKKLNPSILHFPFVKEAVGLVFNYRLIKEVDNVGRHLVENREPRYSWTQDKAKKLKRKCHRDDGPKIKYHDGGDEYKQLVDQAVDNWITDGWYKRWERSGSPEEESSCFRRFCLGHPMPGGASSNDRYSHTTGVGAREVSSRLTVNSRNMGTGGMGMGSRGF